ncbi:MAG: hypothetical protein H0A75_00020 [Candidatus Methanofishera endochildressiae]|uniref:Uncharacterized protein n=1 Tax=Candidatus Methanofishera endochildressiae TaxID=2738884 RepID=A0A7Z0SEG2_9GAMM|nr:hypothetical protein [Candidatus Methanofishera endochildressiae]
MKAHQVITRETVNFKALLKLRGATTEVYSQLPKKTVYCGASYNDSGVITDANGFSSTKYKKRGKKVEWEHVVPAELFGRSFSSWRYGDPACVTGKGQTYKGKAFL